MQESAMTRPNSEKYAKMFRACTTKGKAIKSIQVQEMVKVASMKIVLTLWDGTLISSSLPGWFYASENKDFIYYYVDEILAPALTGHDPLNQAAIDEILDNLIGNISLDELEKLARNVNWAMSVAVCKAGACCKETSAYMYIAELAVRQHNEFKSDINPKFKTDFIAPTPYLNVANGGLHLGPGFADQHLVLLLLAAKSFNDATRIIQKVYHEYYKVRSVEIDVKCAIDDGDEGSYTPSIKDIKICLRSMEEVIANLGFKDEVSIGVYIGASKFYKHDKRTYCLNLSEEVDILSSNSASAAEISAVALQKAYLSLCREFKRLGSFEDMFHMNDQEYSSKLTKGVAEEFVITEFDCASYEGVFKASRGGVGNCFHLKVGEIGSVTKCIDFVISAKIAEWSIILSSHDSCETSDPFLADLCVGLSLDLIKIGVSCITSACNICNRVRELEIERAEEDWRRWPISCADHRVKSALAWFRNESSAEQRHCCDAAVLEMKKKSYFKEWGLHGY